MCLEIQASLPSPPATYGPYMRGVYIAYGVVTWAYFGVAFTGYWVRPISTFPFLTCKAYPFVIEMTFSTLITGC